MCSWLPVRLLAVVAAVAVMVAACGTPWALHSDEASGSPPPAAFLRSPAATFGDALRELGPPSREFVRDRVSMWELTSDGERLVVVPAGPAPLGEFTLVVAFDERGTVAKWSLVRLHRPSARG